jgi:hypothetical protein
MRATDNSVCEAAAETRGDEESQNTDTVWKVKKDVFLVRLRTKTSDSACHTLCVEAD